MIAGTAGHIDHGKTTLVRALTGVDTDRLPEEKARGMSIELGYAFLDVPGTDTRIGFIDVPGHERLVHTMLAGATGIDFALLLVAADDGVMPQTREHVAMLSLLGLSRGAVVLTKIDRVDTVRIEQVRAEVGALLAGTSLADAPVLTVSATTGLGIDALRRLLFDAARDSAHRAAKVAADDNGFRLAVDRSFTLPGIGTVVTGTIHAGRVRVGDELAITPSRSTTSAVPDARVRSLHAQNLAVTEAQAGQRCAVALAGLSKEDVTRGQWLTAPGIALSTDRLDALLTLWHGEARPLRSGMPVHVHVGASDTLGTVAVLQMLDGDAGTDGEADSNSRGSVDSLSPGRRGYVQVVLREPIAAWRGDRIVLRDASATRAVAGGIVLDPFAPTRYRRTPQRIAELAAWSLPDPAARLQALVDAAPGGVPLQRWRRAEGAVGTLPPLPPGSLHGQAGGADSGASAIDRDWALGAAYRDKFAASTLAALQAFHAREPELLGPDAARLRRLAAPRLPEPLWRALLADLQARRAITLQGAFVHLPDHGLRLSAIDARLAQKILPLLLHAGFEGAWARDLARDTRESEALLRTTLARLAQRGELHQVVKDLCYAPATIAQLAAHARAIAAVGEGSVAAAGFRDATGLGRKRAIQILEYFDRIGLLCRVGDVHRLRSDTAIFAEVAT